MVIFSGNGLRVMEDLDVGPGTFRVGGDIAAPGIVLAFAVQHHYHHWIGLKKSCYCRHIFRFTHYSPSLEPLKGTIKITVLFKAGAHRPNGHNGSPLRSRNLSRCRRFFTSRAWMTGIWSCITLTPVTSRVSPALIWKLFWMK